MNFVVEIIIALIAAASPILVAIFNKKIDKKVTTIDEINKEVKELKNKTQENKNLIEENIEIISDNERQRLRYSILNFSSDLRKEQKKTRQEFETIFEMYDKYELIIQKLKMKNGYLDSEFSFIKEIYERGD